MAYLKRGQVTPFIIIGILLLIGAVMLFTAREQKTFAPQAPTAVQDVPLELDSLNVFITRCVESVSKEAIEQLGQHGGYIDPASAEFGTRVFRFDASNEWPTDSDALTFSPEFYIPYWHHLASPNVESSGITFKNQAPDAGDIEKQISKYTEKNLPSCLDFSSFVTQGFTITTTGALSAKTVLTANAVVVDVKQPLKIQKGAAVYELKNFRATHDIALQKLLDFANHLTTKIVQGQSFEKIVILALSAHAGLENDLPPFSASQHGGTKKTWSESAIKPTVENIVSYTIEKVPVKGTKNYVPFEQADPTLLNDPVRRGQYLYLQSLDVTVPDINTRQYEVEFSYLPSWKSYFDVVKGDIIGPVNEVSLPGAAVVSMLLSDLPTTLRTYQTPYDVSIPVLVQIRDPAAFNSKGYDFWFALEANVRDNEPLTADYRPSSPLRGFDDFSLLCNENQKTSAPVTLKVSDADSGRSIPNAEITFNSGASCSMGVTKTEGTLTSKFPRGFGELEVNAPGYLGSRVSFTAPRARPKTANVQLQPFIEKNIRVQKYAYEKRTGSAGEIHSLSTNLRSLWALSQTSQDLLPAEKAVVTLELVSPGAAPFTAAVSVSGTQNAPVRLVPGKYKATITTFLFEPMVIPKCSQCVCTKMKTDVGITDVIGLTEPDVECAERKDVDAANLPAPFTEGTISFVIDIPSSGQELKLSTLVMNLRAVPDTRTGGATVHERMVSDLGMLGVMQEDVNNNQQVRQLLQPR